MHPSIRLEGSILAADILDAIERGERSHQSARDFGLDPTAKVKDEIADAWAAARAYWAAYQVKIARLREGATGTTETRNQWMVPLLGLLGYQLSLAEAETLLGKTYRISHRDTTRDRLPVHLIGWHESLDRRSTLPNAPRMSPHGLVQEYLNLTEHVYGLVSNGRLLRLLRDSSRLVKLTFLEFDLERIFTEELFADFALLYRLLHASRLPAHQEAAGECPMEVYHQDSLDSGSRIRDGLARAVKSVVLSLGEGFLNHPDNQALRDLAALDLQGRFARDYYAQLLRLIYRILFLMVVEERGLAQPANVESRLREIHALGYSLARLRRLAETPRFAEDRHQDAWLALTALFRLLDESGRGRALGIAPLGGDLFSSDSLALLASCALDNTTFLGALRQLSLFQHPTTGATLRVNYGALNVEEFGSVYQGLLEFEPRVSAVEGRWQFHFAAGDERTRTGSHYTPEELVQPLLKHSLEPLLAEALQKPTADEKGQALLSLKVCDPACGSGHILLAAARRIATELAVIRTGDDQPSPAAFREAVRDVIKNCLYGMDLNPLAVELCKVALWLEAHVPGQSLSFLDHRILCGNAIVGLARVEELQRGIPDEAFKTLPDDDKDIAAALRRQNRQERRGFQNLHFGAGVQNDLETLRRAYHDFAHVPEQGAGDYAARRAAYERFRESPGHQRLQTLADLQVAPFYLPKTRANRAGILTHDPFTRWLESEAIPDDEPALAATAVAARKRFAHWFIECWEVMQAGGFDLIIGNPPYLGGQALSGSYGHAFCEWVKWQYAPAGLSDLVVYFLRRIYTLLRPGGFLAVITTNSVKDGDVRKDGLEQILSAGGTINMAVRGIKWPGVANLVVSLLTLRRGDWPGPRSLDGKPVDFISAFFEDSEDGGEPLDLQENANQVFQGSIFLGDGFLLSHEEAAALVTRSARNAEVIAPLINGQELNNRPDQVPGRSIINFQDWPLSRAQEYEEPFRIVETEVKPLRESPEQKDENAKLKWWLFKRPTIQIYNRIEVLPRCFVAAATTKYLNFSASATQRIFANTIYVFTTDRWDHYAVVQSTVHEVWARKYSGALETRLRYSPSDCFETFAFPAGQWQQANPELAALGERYHEHRRALMLGLWLGLTDVYNLFHAPDLDDRLAKLFAKRARIGDWQHAENMPPEQRDVAGRLTLEQARDGVLQLRALHRELDHAVLAAYGWDRPSPAGPAIELGHDFHEVETLPENDRVRYTLSPAARRDLLARLLKLNHQRAAEEAAQAPPVRAVREKKIQRAKAQDELL